MDKDAWLKSIGLSVGAVGGQSSSSSIPAPSVDANGTRSDSLELSWRWNDSAAAAQFDHFEITWRAEADVGAPWKRQRVPGSSPSFSAYKLRGLSPNTLYAVAVEGIPLGSGRQPERGKQLSVCTAPAAPATPEHCGGTDRSISLRWRPVAGNGLRYAVYGSAALGFAKVYTGEHAYCTINGLDHGKEYGFRVCAMNSQGGASDFSPELTVRCGAVKGSGGSGGGPALITPELLKVSHESLSMRWEPPLGGARTYVVELAEAEDGVPPNADDWSTIYEGAPPGCEISFLVKPSGLPHARD